jgi:hypothetical protein
MRVLVRDEFIETQAVWLRKGKEHVVLAIEQHHDGVAGYRIESEQAEKPMIFEAHQFKICDPKLPSTWVVLGLSGATVRLGPQAFGGEGFWEAYFEGDPKAVEAYGAARDQIMSES